MSSVCEWCDGEGCDDCKPKSKAKPKEKKVKTGKEKKEKKEKPKSKKPASKKLEKDEEGDWDVPDEGEGGWGDGEELGSSSTVTPTAILTAPALTRQKSFVILTPQTLVDRQKAAYDECSDELSITVDEAGCLLRRYQWDYEKLKNEWFADSKKVRQKHGLCGGKPPAIPKSGKVQCNMWGCDEVKSSEADCLPCGHWFCQPCWGDILSAKVQDGRGCIFTVCPAMKCKKVNCLHQVKQGCKCEEMIPENFLRKYVTNTELLTKYERWLNESFVEGCKSIKWCPRPGCTLAVEYEAGVQRQIECHCGQIFCFGCGRPSHQPAPCDLVELYEKMGSSDDATEKFLLATTKQCPGCKVRITKNKACNHMSCANCKHQFCWLCKGDWKEHGSQTGGYYVCKKYNENTAKGIFSDEEKAMTDQQTYLQSPSYVKYIFYRQHFDHHRDAAKFAENLIKDVEKMPNFDKFKKVIGVTNTVIQARQVLQWTYCLCYYLKPGKRKELFEEQQSLLNNFTEQCQEILEKEKDHNGLLESKKHQDLVTRARSIDGFRAKTIEVTESPDFIGLLDYKVFKGEGDSWGCTGCGKTHTGKDAMALKHCPNPSCGACRMHGEPECRVPSCKREGT